MRAGHSRFSLEDMTLDLANRKKCEDSRHNDSDNEELSDELATTPLFPASPKFDQSPSPSMCKAKKHMNRRYAYASDQLDKSTYHEDDLKSVEVMSYKTESNQISFHLNNSDTGSPVRSPERKLQDQYIQHAKVNTDTAWKKKHTKMVSENKLQQEERCPRNFSEGDKENQRRVDKNDVEHTRVLRCSSKDLLNRVESHKAKQAVKNKKEEARFSIDSIDSFDSTGSDKQLQDQNIIKISHAHQKQCSSMVSMTGSDPPPKLMLNQVNVVPFFCDMCLCTHKKLFFWF